MTPIQSHYIVTLAGELSAMPTRERGARIARAVRELGVADKTVYRWLKAHTSFGDDRKRRTDAGVRDVTDAELKKISAGLLGSFRKTGNRIMTFDDIVEILQANGEITTTLSVGRLATILTERGLHPNQMVRPTPAVEQRSLNPNHVWQVDASVCVAYYLSNAQGLQVMDEKKFYKNKPGNLTRVQEERLIRYTAADHYTHEIMMRYYLGSECSLSLTDFLIWCFGTKQKHIVHGVPQIIQMDMGAANTSHETLNFLKRMQVEVIVHQRHNSRANGSVEKANHLGEIHFESRLSQAHIKDLADLNVKAEVWANHHGATKDHSRYGKPRHALWLTIQEDQLRIAPEEVFMRELVSTEPVPRTVDNNLCISYKTKRFGSFDYDLRYVPGVMAGSKVQVVANAFRAPAIDVAYTDAETGEVQWMVVEHTVRGDDGRRMDAPVIGQDLRTGPRGLLDKNRDAVMQIAYGGANADEAALNKEKGTLVFGGKVNPWLPAEQAQLPAYMPKRGTALEAEKRTVASERVSVVEACKALKALMQKAYSPQVYAWLNTKFGEAGVPKDQIEGIAHQFGGSTHMVDAANESTGLRAVGGTR